MLVTKTGVIKRGNENTNYKSLVWLGKPANIASKLTDEANKNISNERPVVQVAYESMFNASDWVWEKVELSDFINSMEANYFPHCARYKNPYMKSFFLSSEHNVHTTPPILVSQNVFDNYKKVCSNTQYWTKQQVNISGYSGMVYGSDMIFTVAKELGVKTPCMV